MRTSRAGNHLLLLAHNDCITDCTSISEPRIPGVVSIPLRQPVKGAGAGIDLVLVLARRPRFGLIEESMNPVTGDQPHIVVLALRNKRLGAGFLGASHLIDEYALAR